MPTGIDNAVHLGSGSASPGYELADAGAFDHHASGCTLGQDGEGFLSHVR